MYDDNIYRNYNYMAESLEKSLKPIREMYSTIFNSANMHINMFTTIHAINELQNTISNSLVGITKLQFNQETIRKSIENLNTTLEGCRFTAENLSKIIGNPFDYLKIDIEKDSYIIEENKDYITFDEANEIKADIVHLLMIN